MRVIDRMQRVGRKNRGNSSHEDCKGNERTVLTVCYHCNQLVDGSTSSKDHVIPQTLRGKGPPKVKGFDYGGVLPAITNSAMRRTFAKLCTYRRPSMIQTQR